MSSWLASLFAFHKTDLKPVTSLNSSSAEGEPEQTQVQLSSSALPGQIHHVMESTVQKIRDWSSHESCH